MDLPLRIRDSFRFMQGNILVLTLTRILGMFCRGMVFPYASLYILALGGEPAQIGFINSLRPLAGLVAFPIAGYLADRAGRVKLIALAGYFSGAILLLYVLAPSWHLIALGGLLQGFAVLQFPPTSAIVADSLSPENRGMGIATMNTVSSTLAIAAPYVAGAIIGELGVGTGMRLLYGTLMIAYLTSATINFRYLRETSSRTREALRLSELPRAVKDAYSDVPAILRKLPRPLSALAGILILGFVANAVAGPFWVVYASQQIGLSSTQWGLILFIETALRSLAYIPAGMAIDRTSRTIWIRTSLLLSLAILPLFVLASTFLHVLLIRATVAVTNALFLPACAALMADLVPRPLRGRVMAALGRGSVMIAGTGGGTGGPGVGFLITVPIIAASIAGGYLYDHDPRYPWLLAAIAAAVALFLSMRFVHDPEQAET
jgi:MFS family permease